MLGIAYKNLLTNKSRTFLAMSALIVGVITIISLISITASFRAVTMDFLGDMTGIIVYEDGAVDVPFSFLDEGYEQKLEKVQGVSAAIPEVWGVVNTIDGEKAKGDALTAGIVTMMGLDPQKETGRKGDVWGIGIGEGRKFKPGDKGVVIIGPKIAEEYKKSIGSMIKIDGEKFRVIGITEENALLESLIMLTMDEARDLLQMNPHEVNSFTVQTYNPDQATRVSELIEFKFPDELQALSASETADETEGMFETLDLALLVISMIAVIIAGVGIINTMLMSIMEREKEIGVLRAVGWTKNDVLKMVMYESILIGVGGGVIGSIIGSAIVLGAGPIIGFPTVVTIKTLITAFGFSVAAGFVGGVYPAWKISKIDPIEAMRS